MRCLIVVALCFVLANANHMNKNRFQRMLNRYQNRYEQPGNMFGSDDVDNHIDDYVDEIRRERMFDRDQCPRGFEDILGEDDENDMDDFQGRQGYGQEEWSGKQGFGQEEWSGKQGLFGRQGFEQDRYPRNFDEDMTRMGRRGYEQEEYPGTSDEEWNTNQMEDMIPMGRQGRQGRQGWGEEETETRSPMLKEVKDANVKLATRLYEQCKNEKDDKNTVVSPISIQLALATLNAGARGNTRRQLARVIAGSLKTQERKQIFKTLVRNLKGLRNIESTGQHSTKINCVTGLFVSQTTRTQQHFIQQVKSTLGATVKHCSFSHKPQQCRSVINQWVAQKTHHKINRIVPQDCITDNTKMILVNALELKATWGPQMRRHVTKEAKFYPLDTKKVKVVEVMETEGRFKYHEDELVKIVGVPTKQRELTLYTIVPKEKDGLTEVEKLHLQDSVQLKQLLDKTDKHTRHVKIQLPKFQIKHKVDVRRTLRKQGVTDAFDSQLADFSGITGISKYQQDNLEESEGYETMNPIRRNPFLDTESESESGYGMSGQRDTKLHLNKFIHQTTIKITENGITATTGSQSEEEYTRTPYGRHSGLDNQEFGRHGGMDNQEFGRHGGLENEEYGMFEQMTGFHGREQTGEKIVKANHAFAFVLKHNPTGQLVMIGRVIDAAQKKVNNVEQTINTVDQL